MTVGCAEALVLGKLLLTTLILTLCNAKLTGLPFQWLVLRTLPTNYLSSFIQVVQILERLQNKNSFLILVPSFNIAGCNAFCVCDDVCVCVYSMVNF